jgi:hypothetical protein
MMMGIKNPVFLCRLQYQKTPFLPEKLQSPERYGDIIA